MTTTTFHDLAIFHTANLVLNFFIVHGGFHYKKFNVHFKKKLLICTLKILKFLKDQVKHQRLENPGSLSLIVLKTK